MLIRLAIAATGLALGTGCVGVDAAGDGAFYPSGFSDGCRTAEAIQSSFAVENYRDQLMFETEPSYRAGWRAGFAQCRRTDDLDNRPSDLGEWDTSTY